MVTKNLQSGRSMVEMLGTLAIIGILSIGGIVGYNYAMDKYRANETINELTLRAMGLMQQVERGEIVELNMEMGNKTKLGYTTDAWIDEEDPHYFYISLTNVPSDICRQILKQNWALPTNIYVAQNLYVGFSSICGKSITTQIDFEFYRDFERTGSAPTYYEDISTYPYTAPEKCSSDLPLQSFWSRECYSCDTTTEVWVDYLPCESICGDLRYKKNGYCILKEK